MVFLGRGRADFLPKGAKKGLFLLSVRFLGRGGWHLRRWWRGTCMGLEKEAFLGHKIE